LLGNAVVDAGGIVAVFALVLLGLYPGQAILAGVPASVVKIFPYYIYKWFLNDNA